MCVNVNVNIYKPLHNFSSCNSKGMSVTRWTMQCEDKWMPNRPQRAFLRDDLGVVYNNNNNNNNKQTKTTNRQKQSSEGRQREAGLVLYWAGGADSIGQVGQTVSGRWGRHYWAGGADRWDWRYGQVVCNEHESLKRTNGCYDRNYPNLKHDQRVTELSDLHRPVNRTSPPTNESRNKMDGFFGWCC